MLNGEGVFIANENPSNAIVGFYTTRIVRAADEAAAERAACAMVQAQWLTPEYKSNNAGGPPQLSIESVQRTSFLAWLRYRNTGTRFTVPTMQQPNLSLEPTRVGRPPLAAQLQR